MTFYSVVQIVLSLIFLVALIGLFVRLSLFGGRRLVALAVFVAIWCVWPFTKALRNPSEIHKEATDDARQAAKREAKNEGAKEPSDVDLIVMSKSAVREMLKDPDTAKFKNVFVSDRSGVRLVCGSVNAKNGLGAYMGYQGFVTNGLSKYTFMQSDVKDFSELWSKSCSATGTGQDVTPE